MKVYLFKIKSWDLRSRRASDILKGKTKLQIYIF